MVLAERQVPGKGKKHTAQGKGVKAPYGPSAGPP